MGLLAQFTRAVMNLCQQQAERRYAVPILGSLAILLNLYGHLV